MDSFTYGYNDTLGRFDPTGLIHSETDAGHRAHVFAYNKHRELVYESHPDFGTVDYGYDRNGNRIARSVNNVCDYYGVDANNKLQWVNHNSNAAPVSGQASPYMLFAYDANGNMTHRERQYGAGLFRSFDLLWDGDDRLRQVNELSPSVGTPLTASYDGDGLRVSKTENWTGSAQTHQYTWGMGGVLFDSLNSATYTPGSAQRVSGTDRFPAADWLGSTRAFNSGSDPDDFAPFQFAGAAGYQSEHATATEPGVGLQLLGERYYDPAVGRFISQDPIGLSDYGYCANDPVGLLDPSGLHYVFLGDKGYEQKVRTELNQIRSGGPVGRYLVDSLDASPFNIYLSPRDSTLDPGAETLTEGSEGFKQCDRTLVSPDAPINQALTWFGNTPMGHEVLERIPIGRKEGFRRGRGSGSTVYFDPDLYVPQVRTSTGQPSPPVIVLAHELVHAFHGVKGVVSRDHKEEELATSRYENALRKELHLAMRLTYRSWTISPVFGETFSKAFGR